MSDWLPHIGSCIDDIAVVRSMYTTDDNHGAQTQFHSGRHMLDGEFPTLGAWVHYGLGSLNDNLPQFISMGNREYWNAKDGHYLGPAHDAIPIRVDPANPLDFGKPANDLSRGRAADRLRPGRPAEPAQGGRVPRRPGARTRGSRPTSWPSACRRRCPRRSTLDTETKATQELYGLDDPATRDFGMQMLATRRFVERGVRFIQVQHGAGGAGVWDAHGGLKANHERNFKAVDKPIAGLLKDLKQRGLLDATIVLFATEFGRTPGSQGTDGRDHHIYGFSVWMAGGGIKGGHRPRRDRRDRLPRRREPALRHRHPRHDPEPARPRLPEARDPRPQAPRDRPRQADHRDPGLKQPPHCEVTGAAGVSAVFEHHPARRGARRRW